MSGDSRFLLIGDHAGTFIPQSLGQLGLSSADLSRHIACDIGVANLGAELSRRLDAPFIGQRYSRLVIDCNRALDAPGSILTHSDGSAVPGNFSLSADDAKARAAEIFEPYHAHIAEALDRRLQQTLPTILISLHSFTPSMAGELRPWRYGVLHRNDSPFSSSILAVLRRRHGDEVGDNQPYAMDGTDFTVPFHVDTRALDYLEIEVRQDLIADQSGVLAVATEVADVLSS